MSTIERKYGWKPSVGDIRDHVADTTAMPILSDVDPRSALGAVFDQGQIGSCTANATSKAFQYDAHLDGVTITPSRLDIYFNEREMEGTPPSSDGGAFGHDAFKYALHTGVFDESLWPYDVSKFSLAPPEVPAAKRHKIKSYKSVPRSVTDFERVLSNRQTIAIGFSVYESFESAEVARTGIMPMPRPSEKLLGGHEVLVVGYLRAHPGYWLVENSWNETWGLGGFFLMPQPITQDSRLSSDFRTVYRAQGS